MFFDRVYPRELGVDFFMVKVPTLKSFICSDVPFYKIIVRWFCLIYQISKDRRLIFCRETLPVDHRVKRKLHMFVCGCGGGVLTVFYSPQAPMERVWNPLIPQIEITEQYESL